MMIVCNNLIWKIFWNQFAFGYCCCNGIFFNKNTKRLDKVATLGIVDSNGVGVVNPEVAQGFLEYSNVAIQNEFLNLMPTLKAYDANRQILMIENSLLQKTISQLSSAQ